MHQTMPPFSRRRTLTVGLGAALAAALPARTQPRAFGEADYSRGFVIDAQGGFMDPDADAGVLDLLAQSGLTAISTTMGLVGNGPGRYDSVVADIAQADGWLSSYPKVLAPIRSFGDLRAAKASGRVGLIYNLQDTSALDGDASRVAVLKHLGIRVVQLTYNKRGLSGDGCQEPGNAGVSDFGRKVISEINAHRVLLDLAHGGERTVAEAASLSARPSAVTHTGCRALVNHPRNLTDETLRTVADRGGVVGIYFMSYLRSGIGDPPRDARGEDLLAHIEHAVKVCGEDHVGIGTDGGVAAFVLNDQTRAAQKKHHEDRVRDGVASPGDGPDVFNYLAEYNGPRKLLTLGQDLAKRGWPAARVDKLLGGNFGRLFGEVWDA
jgi:membrane dipeptidase